MKLSPDTIAKLIDAEYVGKVSVDIVDIVAINHSSFTNGMITWCSDNNLDLILKHISG